MDALVDLTGGLAERYDVNQYDPGIYQLISRAHKSGAFIACAKKVGNLSVCLSVCLSLILGIYQLISRAHKSGAFIACAKKVGTLSICLSLSLSLSLVFIKPK